MSGVTDAFSIESDLQRAVAASSRFYSDPSTDNTARLDDTLRVLVQAVSSVERTGRLQLSSQPLTELLNYCPTLLTSPSSTLSTRSKVVRFLFNIVLHNVSIRRHVCSELEMCSPVWTCLKQSLHEKLGSQQLIDILKLLQVLTYEKCLTLGIWTNDLISYLIGEVVKEPEVEWVPFCMATLCNLACRSKSAGNRIRKSSNYKGFLKRLIKLLQHESRMVVVSALVLVGYLDEKIRDVVYSPQNMASTFQCVFNVLIIGDSLLTRHLACDLLKRLVVSDAPTISSQPVVTTTGKDLMCYSYFAKCIQQTAGLLVTLDAQVEETVKILDLLLALCSLSSMRSAVCDAILSAPAMSAKSLITPVLAISRTSRLSFGDIIDPCTPMKALRLLNYLMKEAGDAGKRVVDYVPCEHFLQIVELNVKTTVDTGAELVGYQCERVTEGLRLAEVLSQDEEVRLELLTLIPSSLCAHLAESQLLANPILVYMSKPPANRTESVPEWSIQGVSIVLDLLKLLAALKDFSKAHKDQYWRSLKDERLVPFIAYAISHGGHQMVYDALVLYTHCSQVQAFPTRWLADLIASCSTVKQRCGDGSLNTSRENRKSSDMDHLIGGGEEKRRDVNGRDAIVVDELLEKLKNGMDIRDVRTSELLSTYEKKIDCLKSRERELESLITAKDAALAQSEKLRLQYRVGQQGTNEEDLSRIRSLVAEQEKLQSELKKLNDDISDVRKENAMLVEENESERKLGAQLRAGKEEFKQKFEAASKVALEKQEHCTMLIREKQAANDALKGKEGEVAELKRLVEESEKREADTERRAREYKEKIEAEMAERVRLQDEYRRSTEADKSQREKEFAAYRERTEAELKELRDKLNSATSEQDRTKNDLERMRKIKEEIMSKLAGEF